MNKPLTRLDLDELDRLVFETSGLGSREHFERVFEHRPVAELVRSLVGLDREAAKQAFAEFLDGSRFSADQIRFVNYIIDYLTQNGVMPPERLYEAPCTDVHPAGLDGVFSDAEANRVVEILDKVRQNASTLAAA